MPADRPLRFVAAGDVDYEAIERLSRTTIPDAKRSELTNSLDRWVANSAWQTLHFETVYPRQLERHAASLEKVAASIGKMVKVGRPGRVSASELLEDAAAYRAAAAELAAAMAAHRKGRAASAPRDERAAFGAYRYYSLDRERRKPARVEVRYVTRELCFVLWDSGAKCPGSSWFEIEVRYAGPTVEAVDNALRQACDAPGSAQLPRLEAPSLRTLHRAIKSAAKLYRSGWRQNTIIASPDQPVAAMMAAGREQELREQRAAIRALYGGERGDPENG